MNKFIQARLLFLAAAFLCIQALIMTLAPAVRLRNWQVDYQFSHWLALALWGLFVARAHYDIVRKLPDADPYLLPAAALTSGWGMLVIWRLDADFGARQALWLAACLALLSFGTRLDSLEFVRRYKYLLLTSGLVLTALTLIFGTNPSGSGPRLWLGYDELYLQPSEPLKLLLIGFLAAYLADRLPARLRIIHILYPTIILSGIVILLLIVQRDLGTAAIFTALYTIIIYLATGRRQVVLIALILLAGVGLAGYYFVGIVHARIEAWLNPWLDPAAGSFQIIQALIGIANGGILGTGPGLGSPGFIPVAISDFIYAAVGEEYGLLGTLGLLALMSLIVIRGLHIALRASDTFRRFLAAGIAIYFGIQTILIVGGNLRLLPLTGVTLPFVSYGGSSLVTSFVGLLILIHISNHLDIDPAPLPNPWPYFTIGTFLTLGLFASAMVNGWWSIIRGPDLLTRVDNPRRALEERYVQRGQLFDRSNSVITSNSGQVGQYTRDYKYPDLAPVTGFIDSKYGQTGLESTLDDYLRGLKGSPASTIFWNSLLYGTDPPGLDVRLSIDLELQTRADEMLAEETGAIILINAQSGEILVMASHPTFNPNYLAKTGPKLLSDPAKPLINRATLGQYPAGSIMEPFIQALYGNASGDDFALDQVYQKFGFFQTPEIPLDVASASSPGSGDAPVHVSPLQMALAATALSNHGVIPAPRIAMAVDTPSSSWISLPVLGKSISALQPPEADDASNSHLVEDGTYWQYIGHAQEKQSAFTWYIGGTPANWQATPLAIVVLLEDDNEQLAEQIGRELLATAMHH